MQPFSIQTKLMLADWQAYQRAFVLRVRHQQETPASVWKLMGLWAAIVFVSYALVDVFDIDLQPLSVLVGIVFCAAVVLIAQKRNSRRVEPREEGAFFTPSRHDFDAAGITTTQPGARSFNQWQIVSDVTATPEHIFIWLDSILAYVIPVRDLPEGMTAEAMLAGCKEWMATTVVQDSELPSFSSEAAVEMNAAPPAPESKPSTWRTVFRLLTLRSVGHPLPGRPLLILMLSLSSLALWAGLSWFYYLPNPEFYFYGAPALSWYVLAVLAAAAAMARRLYPQVAFLRVCALLAILLPVLIIGDFAITLWVPKPWSIVAYGFLAGYATVFCARGLHGLTGNRQPLAVVSGLAVAWIFVWLANTLYVYPAVWTSSDTQADSADYKTDRASAEALLFEQPARIDASVARIERATGEAPAGFFVGFAGYGDQRVFAEEIKFAARKFDERYDTAGRTLLLINDRRDRQAQPLATVAGLNYALKAVASKMRLDQDVLFLALSSHGSEDPVLSVENGMFPLRDLTGDALAEALQASGIKWRVIVISACHAGAFIKSLQDPYTVVITAASPDRTSFGCSDERDLTYFGEAFFRDALPKATSLRDAFDTATILVTEREKEEGFDASNPQAFFGEQIEPRLAPMLRAASAP